MSDQQLADLQRIIGRQEQELDDLKFIIQDLQREVAQVCRDRAYLLDLVTDSQYLLASVIVTAGYAMSPAWHAAAKDLHAAAKDLLGRMGAGYREDEG